MNLEILFKDIWENRLRICLRMKLKDTVDEEYFKMKLKNLEIDFAPIPSLINEREFMLFIFQDELDVSISFEITKIISEYAKEITISFKS